MTTKNGQSKNITSKMFFSLFLFLVNSVSYSGELYFVFKHFEVLKILSSTFSRKNCICFDLWALSFWRPCKALKKAKCRQPRLVKLHLHSNLYFKCKNSGTALVETIVSYKLLPSLSQENTNTFPSALLDASTN